MRIYTHCLIHWLPETFPENLPKGGTIYHYSWNEDAKKHDWRADGYRVASNGILNRIWIWIRQKKPTSRFFDGPQSVSRSIHSYSLHSWRQTKSVIIEYRGERVDCLSISGMVTRNMVTGHMLERCHQFCEKLKSASASAPTRIYQTMVTAGAAKVNQTTGVPRNIEQVRNTLKHQRTSWANLEGCPF